MRLCAVSVDLDEIPNYHAIHGLPAPQSPGATAVHDVALDRLDALAERAGLPLTLFAVGASLSREQSAQSLRRMADHGHEIANHSLDHFYDLTRRTADEMRRQIEHGADVIERAVGRRPIGFRSPGYVITDELMDVLIASGHKYDSSVFPCPAYFATKAAKLTMIAVRGRRSRSVQDHPRVLLSPTRPYRPGKPYYRQGDLPLIELPVQVTRGARLPYIGTTLTLSGSRTASLLTKMVLGEPVINLELHGMDVLDSRDGLQALIGHQPDVDIDHGRKVNVLEGVFAQIRKSGYRFVTLQQAATEVERALSSQP
ncbi:MAG: polysaccharide deacetylase family protein [Deltaproteobacteria bacterium]|nr:polysaccharide deacetylase family protein [Deltaproteobacteria bacterium]